MRENAKKIAPDGKTYAEVRKEQLTHIKQAKLSLYKNKRSEVDNIKQQLAEQRLRKQQDQMQEAEIKAQRADEIKNQMQRSVMHVQDYQDKKKGMLKNEYKDRTIKEKKLIYEYESEAQQLEKLEEQLIQELQETQEEEREAYKELEEAMLEASRSKRERLGQTGSTAFSELPGIKNRGQPRTAGGKMGTTNGFSQRSGGQSMDPARMSDRAGHQRTSTGGSFKNAQFGANTNIRSSYAPNSMGKTAYN